MVKDPYEGALNLFLPNQATLLAFATSLSLDVVISHIQIEKCQQTGLATCLLLKAILYFFMSIVGDDTMGNSHYGIEVKCGINGRCSGVSQDLSLMLCSFFCIEKSE